MVSIAVIRQIVIKCREKESKLTSQNSINQRVIPKSTLRRESSSVSNETPVNINRNLQFGSINYLREESKVNLYENSSSVKPYQIRKYHIR